MWVGFVSLYLQEFIHAPAFACCANLINAYMYILYELSLLFVRSSCHVSHIQLLFVYVPVHFFMHSYSVIPEAMVSLFCLLCMIHSLICLLVSTSLCVSCICSGHCCVVHNFVLLT